MIIKKNGKLPPSYVIASEVIFIKGYEAKGVYPTYCIYKGVVKLTNELPFLTLAINSVINGYSSAEPEENHFP